MSSRRIVYDMTTLFYWTGPPSGIVRVDTAFAHWAATSLPDVHFAVFDPGIRQFRKVADRWVEPLIAGRAFADTWGLRAGPVARSGYPRVPWPITKWLTQPRRQLFAALERIRLDGRPAPLRVAAERLQARMMSEKYQAALVGSDGTRRAYVPFEEALEGPISPGARDTLISVGSSWTYLDPGTFKALKEETGCTLVAFCHDLIPLTHPEYCVAGEVEQFRAYFRQMIPHIDRVIVSTRTNDAELRAYCAGENIRLGETRVTPFGAEIPSARRRGPVEGLVPGRYALFVSTIEPRKGHRLLCRVWAQLRAAGVLDKEGFKLAIVGRPGWSADAILSELRAEAEHGTIRLFAGADDALLAALYDGAAFCVYPSMYEGYGLPIVEAFARGKAVITSNRGSIPEIAAAFAPCLDPTDEAAWLDHLRRWIIDPASRRSYENKIRAEFRPASWQEAARLFFRAALEAGAGS
jgi:glycosyltransferase involved in cell wall biosynthesis